MRPRLLYLLIFLFTCLHSKEQVVSVQEIPIKLIPEGLYKFSKNYFRSDPFASEFSTFLKHLINDPEIHDKIIQPRTDSTLYSFFGVYNNYNPFFFSPKRIEVLLEERAVWYSDSTRADTIFFYQLLGYANDNVAGESDIKKEFEKIHRQNKRKFASSNYNEEKNGDEIKAAIYNYFVPIYRLAPVSLIRGKITDQHEWVLNITLRFKMSANEAILAAPFYGP